MFSERYIPRKREIIAPDKQIRRLIIGDKQRCLTCKTYVLRIGSKGRGNLQDRNKPYVHAESCPQKGRF